MVTLESSNEKIWGVWAAVVVDVALALAVCGGADVELVEADNQDSQHRGGDQEAEGDSVIHLRSCGISIPV